MTYYITATVHLRDETKVIVIVFLYTFSIQNYPQCKLRYVEKIRSLPNEKKLCRICTSNVSYGIEETVSGPTGGEFDT